MPGAAARAAPSTAEEDLPTMLTDREYADYRESYDSLRRLAARCRADAGLRARIEGGDRAGLELEVPAGVELRVVEQTPERYYLPLPPNPNAVIAESQLEGVAGGSSTLSSAGTASTIPSSVSTIGTAGSASAADVRG